MAKPQNEPVFLKIHITKDVYEHIEAFKQAWEGENVDEVVVRVDIGDGTAHEIKGTLQEFLTKLGLDAAASRLLIRDGEAG